MRQVRDQLGARILDVSTTFLDLGNQGAGFPRRRPRAGTPRMELEPGPAPLVFTSSGAITGDGSTVPVAASDGALFVTPIATAREP